MQETITQTSVLSRVGLKIPKILLPKPETDLLKWAVVACDQFTSEPEYWNKVEEVVGDAPSTFRITLPEVYLESEDKEERIARINARMRDYLENGVLEEKFEGFVVVDRQTKNTTSRKGLVVALDLEKYDFNKGSKTLIRATEGTVVSRIPPRLEIRQNALVELPHIMVLIDDPKRTVIEPLFDKNLEVAYETELMLGGGRIKGYKLTDRELIEEVAVALERLISSDGFLYAMGDGNHSLATAKAHWENTKQLIAEEEKEEHPARYALVELVNIHDPGLEFEPIHRVIFNVNPVDLLGFLGEVNESGEVRWKYDGTEGRISLREKSSNLAVGNLQILLDKYLELHPEAKIDYVHGEDSVVKLTESSVNVGFILSGMEKEELFETVEKDGALPRKTFSMGEAEEKRYYLEARRIVK